MTDWQIERRDDVSIGGSVRSGLSSMSTSSKKCDSAKHLSRATTQATIAAKSILASGGSEDTALKTAKAAAQAVLLQSHLGTSAFDGRRNPTNILRRRKIKRQSEVIASMALVSATNQVSNGTEWDLLSGTEKPNIRQIEVPAPQKAPKRKSLARPPRPSLPPRPVPKKQSSPPLVKIEPEELSTEISKSTSSSDSKVSRLSMASREKVTEHRSAASAAKAEDPVTMTRTASSSDSKDKSLRKGTMSNDSNTGSKKSTRSGSKNESQDAVFLPVPVTRIPVTRIDSRIFPPTQTAAPASVPSVVTTPQRKSPKSRTSADNGVMTVLQTPRARAQTADETSVDDPIYFVDHSNTNNQENMDRYDMLSGDDSTAGESHSVVSGVTAQTNATFLEKHVDPCIFSLGNLWKCGATEVSDKPTKARIRAPSKQKLTIVDTDVDTDSEYEVESLLGNGRSSYPEQSNPYEYGLSERKRQYRAKKDRTPPVNENTDQPMESEPRDDVPVPDEKEEGDENAPIEGIQSSDSKKKKAWKMLALRGKNNKLAEC